MKLWYIILLVIIGLLVLIAGWSIFDSRKRKNEAGKLPDDRYPLW